ncbi:MAG: MFS transporter, partial [Rickettsiales bacterium]
MSLAAARLSMIFSCIGHFYIHMMTAFYFVIVLTLVVEWDEPYSELLQLWIIASALLGLVAIPAGRLADRWSVRGMMVLFFIGMGGASILCGLVSSKLALVFALSGIGIFGAIYHPVGIPWLIRNSGRNTGKALAINGIFGSLGNAGAGVIAGLLIEFFGWRMAFIVPGAVCLITGAAMLWFVLREQIVDGENVESHA